MARTTMPEIRLTPEQLAFQAILAEAVRESRETRAQLQVHTQEEMGRYGEMIGAFSVMEAALDKRMDTFSEQLGELGVQTTKLAVANSTSGSRAGGVTGGVVSAVIAAIALVASTILSNCSPW